VTGTRTRLTRLAVVVLFGVPCLLAVSPTSSLAVTKTTADQVRQAKAKVDALNHELELVGEEYNAARLRLAIAEQKLEAARVAMQTAQSQADAALSSLASRAVDAFTNPGSQLNVLLGAQSLADFSDRLEYMGTIAQSDADLATAAQAAAARAKWAAQQYTAAVGERQTELVQVTLKQTEIRRLVSQQIAEYRRTTTNRTKYLAYLKAQRVALQQLRAQRQAAQQLGNGDGNPPGDGGNPPGGGGNYVPPPNATAVEIAIGAAKSVLGAPYVFAAADPSVGFDCSGLTMWSWAQAGVSLPHSAAMQYDMLPHVPLTGIQPGDLLFFFSPISHVALYLGDGLMIHTTNPGPGGGVRIEALGSIWTPLLVGAARPG
jgi:cell wall-associated NlpC family hydrolase